MQGDPKQVRYAQLFARGVECELRVNDIPVTTARPDEMKTSGFPIREYMLVGDNTAELSVGNLDGPAGKGGYSGMAKVTARIADFWEGEDLDESSGIEKAKMSPSFDEETRNPMRDQSQFTSDIGDDWAWARAPELVPAQIKANLDQLMAHLANLFAKRDAAAMIPFFEPSIRDRVKAYPVLSVDGQARMMTGMFAGADPETWQPIPFDPQRARYRLVANGRMVEARDPDGLPLIRSMTSTPDSPGEDPNYVGLHGFWGLHEGQLKVLK